MGQFDPESVSMWPGLRVTVARNLKRIDTDPGSIWPRNGSGPLGLKSGSILTREFGECRLMSNAKWACLTECCQMYLFTRRDLLSILMPVYIVTQWINQVYDFYIQTLCTRCIQTMKCRRGQTRASLQITRTMEVEIVNKWWRCPIQWHFETVDLQNINVCKVFGWGPCQFKYISVSWVDRRVCGGWIYLGWPSKPQSERRFGSLASLHVYPMQSLCPRNHLGL